MARDMHIAEQGYVMGTAVLKDANGEYILQKREGLIFNDYYKTYISGDMKGKTSELGFFDFLKEIDKRDKKYGYFNWLGNFVPGEVPLRVIEPLFPPDFT